MTLWVLWLWMSGGWQPYGGTYDSYEECVAAGNELVSKHYPTSPYPSRRDEWKCVAE